MRQSLRKVVCMPVWPGVKTTAQQDDLAGLLLQVHVDQLHCFQQLGIEECCGYVIKGVIFSIAWQRSIHSLMQPTQSARQASLTRQSIASLHSWVHMRQIH